MALRPDRRGVLLPDAGSPARSRRRLAWAVLAALLVALLAGAVTFDPAAAGRRPTGEAATYAAQALSLAHDLDLRWSREDHDRFRSAWGAAPEGVRLRSRSAGERIAYDVPVPYAFALAPWVRVAPVRGPAVANALLLALAAVAAASTLARRVGPAAPLLAAIFVFASIAFVHVFRIGPDLFALAAVVCAYALAYRGEGPMEDPFGEVYTGRLPGEEGAGAALRWLGAGALVGSAAAFHPVYLVLALPLALAPPRGSRRRGGALVAAGLALALAAAGAVGWAAGDDPLPWAGGGRLFFSETGFPAVDVAVADWPRTAPPDAGWASLPNGPPEPVLHRSLWGWNLLFVAAGRAVGVVPYLLPALLALALLEPPGGGRSSRGRWLIPWVAGAAIVLFLLVRPFDFAGVSEAPANRWLLPVYGAVWFAAARPVRPAWVLAAAVAAAPFLYPSWLAPRTVTSPEAMAAGRYVSPVAGWLLPHESTQRDVPGVRELQHGVVRVRLLGPGIAPSPAADRLRIDTGAGGELFVASPLAVDGFRIGLGPGSPSGIEVADGEVEGTTFTPAGGVVLEIDPGSADRRHPLWWTRSEVFLYRLGLAFPEPEAPGAGAEVDLAIVPLYGDGGPSP